MDSVGVRFADELKIITVGNTLTVNCQLSIVYLLPIGKIGKLLLGRAVFPENLAVVL